MAKQFKFVTWIGITLVVCASVYYYKGNSIMFPLQVWGSKRDGAILKGLPAERVTAVSCSELANGAPETRNKALWYQAQVNHTSIKTLTTDELKTRTRDCTAFLKDRPYTAVPLSKEEENFPIAFSILLYQNPGQVERLLRAIYQPQNYYCLHVDASSPESVQRALEPLAACFPNVFVASKAIDVVQGDFSLLDAELVCMEDLFNRPNWKYVINLTGQEYPLKTNLELVRILKIFNGSSDVAGNLWSRRPLSDEDRTGYVYPDGKRVKPKDRSPSKLTLYKGPVHIVVSRSFVDYVLHDRLAVEFREWARDSGHYQDEFFFNTLQHNPAFGIPGAYRGPARKGARTIVRHEILQSESVSILGDDGPVHCHGKYVRRICIPGVEDLPVIVRSRKLFLSKLQHNYQPLVQDCLEELHFQKIRDGFLGINTIVPKDLTFYRKLPFVKYRTNH